MTPIANALTAAFLLVLVCASLILIRLKANPHVAFYILLLAAAVLIYAGLENIALATQLLL